MSGLTLREWVWRLLARTVVWHRRGRRVWCLMTRAFVTRRVPRARRVASHPLGRMWASRIGRSRDELKVSAAVSGECLLLCEGEDRAVYSLGRRQWWCLCVVSWPVRRCLWSPSLIQSPEAHGWGEVSGKLVDVVDGFVCRRGLIRRLVFRAWALSVGGGRIGRFLSPLRVSGFGYRPREIGGLPSGSTSKSSRGRTMA